MAHELKKLLYLEVDDHAQQTGWTWKHDIKMQGHPIKCVGWLVKEDDKRIVLTQGYDTESAYTLGFFTVIKSTIIKKRVINI